MHNQFDLITYTTQLLRVASCSLSIEQQPRGVRVSLLESCPGGERIVATRLCSDWAEASTVYTETQATLFEAQSAVRLIRGQS